MCNTWEVAQVLENNGVVYWEETYHSILHIIVYDTTEKIKKLVRQKENYEVEIRLSGLSWGRPKYHGWFESSSLKRTKYQSTLNLRELQVRSFLNEKADHPLKKQPVYFITATGNDVPERVMANIVDVQIIEK
jgi:hypothetical protein